jgi:hypothetical protein
MPIKHIMLLCAVVTMGLLPSRANAYRTPDESSYALASSNLCVESFSSAERKYGIPKHLLMAIANTESGRFNPQVGKVVPWPWTLNVEGQGAYFNTMHDAMTAVKRAQQQGKDSIDVGCMQISLKHHPDAFATLLDALSPAQNVEYAAKFLRTNYDALGSWPEAIAAYHSRTPSRGNPYYAMVRQRWQDVRSNAGGAMLENSDYMVAGVKVTRMPVAVQQPRRTSDSEFNIAMRESADDVRVAPKIFARGGATPVVRKAGRSQRVGTMKVITVAAEDMNRGDAIVTITPTSQRTIVADAPAVPRASSSAKGSEPNWIFGHE